MQITRRNALLTGGALVAAAPVLAECAKDGTAGIDPAVIDAINKALQESCGVLAFAQTIAAFILTTFPAVAGQATIAQTVLDQIVSILCGAFKSATPQQGKLAVTFQAGGKTLDFHGWHIVDGKLVQF